MKYSICFYTDYINMDKARDYIVKTNRRQDLVKIGFNDENYLDCLERIGVTKDMIKRGFIVLGEDNFQYRINDTGIEKIGDKPNRQKVLSRVRVEIRCWTVRRIKAFIRRMLARANSKTMRRGSTISSFKKYVYVNRDEGVVIPYRLKTAKAPNRPLVIFHGGGGTTGYDNFKTLFEFFHDAAGKKVTAEDCNVLIPQWTYFVDHIGAEGIYAENCAELIQTVVANSNVDASRIYVYGLSHGAAITWTSLRKSPALYTASVQAMGAILDYTDVDFNAIKDIPIWIAHSSDDMVASIDSDDYCYERLKALGADIHYTRWDKYGHKMKSQFFKQEPWVEWLLSKTKPTK